MEQDTVIDPGAVLLMFMKKEHQIARLSSLVEKLMKENAEFRKAVTVEVVEEE